MTTEPADGDRFLPWWLWGIVVVEVAVPTFYGIATLLNPSIWGADSLGVIGQLYVTRNFTMAFGVVLAVLLRSRLALLCVIAARYSTDFIDITAIVARGIDPQAAPVLAVFVILLLVAPFFGLRWLWKRR